MSKRLILLFICVFLISASCSIEPKLNFSPSQECCLLYTQDTNEFAGCLGGNSQEQCNSIFESGYNVVYYDDYCENVVDSENMPYCSYTDNDCFAVIENHILFYAENGERFCSPIEGDQTKLYECRYNETLETPMVSFDYIDDCSNYGLTCLAGGCVEVTVTSTSSSGGGGSSSGSSGTKSLLITVPSSTPATLKPDMDVEDIYQSIESCNNNGICELDSENTVGCPSDCGGSNQTWKEYLENIDLNKQIGKDKANYIKYILIGVISILLILFIVYLTRKFKKKNEH